MISTVMPTRLIERGSASFLSVNIGEVTRQLVVALSLIITAICFAADMHAIGSNGVIEMGH
jgi:hypothetical protein